MDHLTPDQLSRLRARLETERDELQQRDRDLLDQSVATPQPDVGDQQDLAAVETAQLNALSLADRDHARLQAVLDALRRIDDGSYGLCADTEEEIPFERLWAEPTARLSVEAQEQREREAAAEAPVERRGAY